MHKLTSTKTSRSALSLSRGPAILWLIILLVAGGPGVSSTWGGDADVSTERLLWDKSLNLRAGLGFKDNVLLGSANRRDSLYVATGLDAMLLRLPVNGPEFYLFLTGDDYRYLKDVEVDSEQTFAAISRVRMQLGPNWQAALGLQYFYQNQVLDVSTTEAELTTIPLTGHNIKLSPAITRKLTERDQLELEVALSRQFLEKPLDHYWEGGPKLAWEHTYGRKSAILLNYAFRQRFFDERQQTDRRGVPQPNSSLEFTQHQIELADRHYWDEKRRWRTETKAGLELTLDNGAGFFDYNRYQLSQQLRYTAESWMVRSSVRFNYYDYPVQLAAANSSEQRHLTTINWTVRGEKNLTKSLKWFAEFEHEQNLSNRTATGYHANSVVTGLDWEL